MNRDMITIGSVEMPLQDFVVSRNAILGITKSGKTYTAKGVAEQLLDRGVPIIIFDAIGVWRYLKLPGDTANAKGFKVVVAGGEHPDLPLNPKSAPDIVRAAIRENIPLVIDLYDSKLSKADWRRIVQQCFRILLYENRGLRHIFLEESAEFAPQKVLDGETYAEVEKLARMGGNKHLGITFINQRAQELNKAVLELCDNVILLRQRGSHAIDALEKWLDRLSPETSKQIADSMPKMTQGNCWIFTENGDVPIRTRSGLIRSLHPDRRMPEQALSSRKSVDADVFIQKLNSELPKLAEERQQNNPESLKSEIRRLEKELAAARASTPAEVKIQIREVPVLVETELHHIKLALRNFAIVEESIRVAKPIMERIETEILKFSELTGKNKNHWTLPAPQSQARVNNGSVVTLTRVPVKPRPVPTLSHSHDPSLGKCERSILIALAQYPQGRTATQVAVLSGYSVSSGGFNNSLSKLRSSNLITRGNPMVITSDGQAALGEWEPLPTGDKLKEHWLARLGKCEAAILATLLGAYPDGLTSEDIAAASCYSASSGGFNNSLSKLRTLELITRGQPIKASDDFFQ